MRHVTGELALAVDRDGLRLIAGMIHDLDLAGFDDEEFEVAVTDREQRLPVAVGLRRDTAAAAQIVDERLLERRERYRLQIVFGHGCSTTQIANPLALRNNSSVTPPPNSRFIRDVP